MSPSSIAWLDTSPEEQRRMRELLRLFEQQESRDELGLGRIRDAISNSLFPGTSVLQTRARYYLFVPWCFIKASGTSTGNLQRRAEAYERQLSETLRQTPDIGTGVIGARAGAHLKTLPSAIFWNGLLTFHILQRDTDPESLFIRQHQSRDADELANRERSDWNMTIPPVPKDFPSSAPGGFRLSFDEASWLREQIVSSVPGTLLCRILERGEVPATDSPAPWLDPAASAAAVSEPDSGARSDLNHAQRFSLAIQGASLLYSLLVAEEYQRRGNGGDEFSPQPFLDRYLSWCEHVGGRTQILAGWDTDEFWRAMYLRNPTIPPLTRRFVDAWIALIKAGGLTSDGLPSRAAERLVSDRERYLKGNQSRLVNEKLLSQWGGVHLGAYVPEPQDWQGGLSYRWPQVRQICIDILEAF